MRDFEFQRHDGDDDGDDAVAEGLHAVFAHKIFQYTDCWVTRPNDRQVRAGYPDDWVAHWVTKSPGSFAVCALVGEGTEQAIP